MATHSTKVGWKIAMAMRRTQPIEYTPKLNYMNPNATFLLYSFLDTLIFFKCLLTFIFLSTRT